MADPLKYETHTITNTGVKAEPMKLNIQGYDSKKEKPVLNNTVTSKRDITIDLSQFLEDNDLQHMEINNKFFNK